MLRFGAAIRSKRTGLSVRERLRLWMLVIGLGLVIAAMRHLQQPETVENLDHLLLGQAPATAGKSSTNEETEEPLLRKTAVPRRDSLSSRAETAPASP